MSKLIKRQDVIELIKNSYYDLANNEDDMWAMIADVEKLPVIEAAPVRHGRWIKYTGTGKVQWMCSECSAEEKNPKVANWCYHCGARMDGEEECAKS